MTALTMRFAAAVGRTLAPGDEIVCTRLDHDANVRPWVIAAERAGATVRFAEPEPGTLELPAAARRGRALRAHALGGGDRGVATPAAPCPTSQGIVAAAHAAGARVYVDAVHAAPHRRARPRRAGLRRARPARPTSGSARTSASCAPRPTLLAELQPGQAAAVARRRCPTAGSSGTLPFESLAGVAAAARYVRELGWDARPRARGRRCCGARSTGCAAIDGVTPVRRRRRPHADADVHRRRARPRPRSPPRWPSARSPCGTATTTPGSSSGTSAWRPHGAVRAGFVHYNDEADADRLVEAVAALGR